MKKKKRYIVILVILIIYILVMFFLLGKDELAKRKQSTTIIVGDYTVWDYSGGSWLNITNSDTIDELNWLDYTVYLDNKELGNYYLWYDDNKWYIFDSKKNAINKEGNLLAYRANYEIKVKDFTTETIKDYSYVEEVLQDNNLSTSSKLTVSDEVLLDIDNDGTKEKLYLISNAFALDFSPSTVFAIVFMVKDGKIYELYNDIAKNDFVNGCKPYLNTVIDIDNNNTYELVVSCGRYSIQEPVDMLYKLTDEGFKILISNQ